MRSLTTVLAALLFVPTLSAAEIDFIETYALSTSRAETLKQLIPGTEEYYYYHCLHYQQSEQYENVDQTLKNWIAKYRDTERIREVLNRQALLTFDQTPQQTIDYIKDQLNIQFNHRRDSLEEQRELPTELDQNQIRRETLTAIALQQNNGRNLEGFEDAALPWLLARELNPEQRRDLLRRLRRVDLPNLPQHVIADLRHRPPVGFGSIPLHRQLLLDQLNECARLAPELLNDTTFIGTYIQKLAPREGIDWQNDRDELGAYLARLGQFTDRLSDAQNSLKAHVLFRRLVFDRDAGTYNRELFDQYLQLPRNGPLVNPRYLQIGTNSKFVADLNANYTGVTRMPIVGDEQELIRSYLAHFFIKDNGYERYEKYLQSGYLKTVFAETKILNGLGDAETWFAWLNPSQHQELRNRVLLDFEYTNRDLFAADEPVALDLHVKNVPTLIVKVFEVNTTNYYRRKRAEIDSSINLDGLVPNWETTYSYDDSPLRSIRRTFSFPELNRAGVYVIDFIGNGQSSRAIVRKGRLRHVDQITAAGHELTVLNEKNEIQTAARAWLDGREFAADQESGTIHIPFTGQPGSSPIVLTSGDFSSLGQLTLVGEQYELQAAFHVNRESLIQHEDAELAARVNLTTNGQPLPLGLLEDIYLTITSEDQDGVPSSHEFPLARLEDHVELVQSFQVPRRLAKLTFNLSAKIKNLRTGQPVLLSATETVALNSIDRTNTLTDLHLVRAGNNYQLLAQGRSGEPLPGRPVTIQLKHAEFRQIVSASLRSDDAGRIQLGPLNGIDTLKVVTVTGHTRSWKLPEAEVTMPREIHVRAGQSVTLPTQERGRLDWQAVSLIEVRSGTYVRNLFDKLNLKGGRLEIAGLDPGNYQLTTWPEGQTVDILVESGPVNAGHVLGPNRDLELLEHHTLAIADPEWTDEQLKLTVAGVTETTRVHVFATHYVPAFPAFAGLNRLTRPTPVWKYQSSPTTLFLTGRNIGDEYRYIIDRRYATRLPGNMLARPSLLLNPWAVRTTETETQVAQNGAEFDALDSRAKQMQGNAADGAVEKQILNDPANLDFLAMPGVTLLNLAPDDNGTITIDRGMLGSRQMIQVVAVDHHDLVSRGFTRDELDVPHADLRLARVLPPDQHFSQRKDVSILPAGAKFTISDLSSARFETYDSLSSVFTFYSTLSDDERLERFRFLLDWPNLTAERKRAEYSEHACHELNLFLYHKDREFFNAAIRPFLANKREKKFLDLWLLEADLTAFMTPWSYARLNTLEKVLLARRIRDERERTLKHLEDLLLTLPVDRDEQVMLFDTALAGKSLDAGLVLSGAAGGMGGFGGGFGGGAMGGGGGFGVAAEAAPAAPAPAAAAENRLEESEQMLGRALGLSRRGGADRMAQDKDVKLFEKAARLRAQTRQLFVALDRTQEWAENNYYQTPLADVDSDLIPLNAFWTDYARHDPARPFLSPHLAATAGNLHEMLAALAVLDLPFEAGKHETERDQLQWTLTAGSPMIIFHEQFRQTDAPDEAATVLVSQNFFQDSDRVRQVGPITEEKYVTDEFLVQTVYGCRAVVTNPSSRHQRLDLLAQIPGGAIPVNGARYTRSIPIDLEPYHTEIYEFFFYFPEPGRFLHYPVHVARDEQLVASAEPFVFNVVKERSKYDTESWEYLSQNGTAAQVLDYLKSRNLELVNIQRIAFRMRDPQFYGQAVSILRQRHVYDDVLWSYSLMHGDRQSLSEFLSHADSFLARTGPWLESPLIDINPITRGNYEHLDYRPLVNARAHQLGKSRQILNDRLHEQYHRLMNILAHKRTLDSADHLEITAYLLIQDRVTEAMEHFQQVNVDQLASRLQYDYTAAYLDFFNDDPRLARTIAARYADYPVDRWRNLFLDVQAQLDEIDGAPTKTIDPLNRDQNQTQLAATEPMLEFEVENRQINIAYQNIDRVEVRYYQMDIELLFSRNPFVQHDSDQFAQIKANHFEQVQLPAGQSTHAIQLPEKLRNSNVLIEITGGGQVRSRAYYANSLTVQLADNYGQLKVVNADSNRPVPRTYIKVYARTKDGDVNFFKDGYTDLRGRFDYASLSTNELDRVERLAILILSEEQGATVREVKPPRQ